MTASALMRPIVVALASAMVAACSDPEQSQSSNDATDATAEVDNDATSDTSGDTSGCSAGSLGCECAAGVCDDGLLCSSDLCAPANAVPLGLDGGAIRACDLALTTTGRRVASIMYPQGVRGHMWTRDARTAVALMRTADEDLGGVVALVVFEGPTPAAQELVTSVAATCYDRRGARVTAASVTAE